MAQQLIWAIKRGDYKTRKITLPAAKYVTGCKLFFGAKPAYDNDASDVSAIAKKTLTDEDIIETKANGDKVYLLKLEPGDTSPVQFAVDATEKDYIAEVQFVDPDGRPTTYPDADQDVEFILRVKADINRRTT